MTHSILHAIVVYSSNARLKVDVTAAGSAVEESAAKIEQRQQCGGGWIT